MLWQNGTPTDLGTFGGPNAVATALNNLSHVVGYSMTSTYAQHGFLWSNGTMTDLGRGSAARPRPRPRQGARPKRG